MKISQLAQKIGLSAVGAGCIAATSSLVNLLPVIAQPLTPRLTKIAAQIID